MKPMVSFFALFLVAAGAFAANLSDELKYLEELTSDEERFVDAMRDFHVAQGKLVHQDMDMAGLYSKQGEQDKYNDALASARNRMALMEEGWKFTLGYYPNNARARNYYGEYLYDYAGRQNEAILEWRKSAALDTKLGNPHNNLGLHYFHHGRYKLGNEHLQKALDIEPDNPDYNFNMAQMYLNHFPQMEKILDRPKKKLFRDAMKYSEKAAKLLPDDYETQQDYAVNFYASENFDVDVDWKDAARAWQKAGALARHDDERFYSYLNEGRTWSKAGDYKKAVAALESALKIRPDSDSAKMLLSRAQNELK